MNFEELTSYRKCGYEGVEELLWVTTDIGGFGEMSRGHGPIWDWVKDHEHFMSQVKSFNTVVQAGGNCGMYPRFYSNYFKNVYTFEPNPLNFYCLDINCQGDNFHKFEGGLGNTTDKLTVTNYNTINVGAHTIRNIPGDVQMYRIDDLNLTSCDLIHLDVEGYEPQALKGSIETIEKFNPVVIVENGRGGDILKDLGYTMHIKTIMDRVYIK